MNEQTDVSMALAAWLPREHDIALILRSTILSLSKPGVHTYNSRVCIHFISCIYNVLINN